MRWGFWTINTFRMAARRVGWPYRTRAQRHKMYLCGVAGGGRLVPRWFCSVPFASKVLRSDGERKWPRPKTIRLLDTTWLILASMQTGRCRVYKTNSRISASSTNRITNVIFLLLHINFCINHQADLPILIFMFIMIFINYMSEEGFLNWRLFRRNYKLDKLIKSIWLNINFTKTHNTCSYYI